MGHIVDSSKINRLHERYLQKIYNDKRLFFEDLLERIILSIYTAKTYMH